MTTFLVAHLEAHGLRVTNAEGSGSNLLCECFNGHGARTPCLSIRKSDGAFKCFSCNVKGRDWKVLVAALGGQLPDAEAPDPFAILKAQQDNSIEVVSKISLPWGTEPWGRQHYRGLSAGFLRRLDARRWYDDKSRCDRILFPITQQSDPDEEPALMGWVARRLDQNQETKYRNAPGMKSTQILYPLDFVRQYLRGDTVVLVEGPMDALRLCHFRIPALAIMGTNNWRPQKRGILVRLGITRCIICTDGDVAGIRCRYETLEPALQDRFDVEHFHPPDGEDPGSMDRRLCLELRDLVQRR